MRRSFGGVSSEASQVNSGWSSRAATCCSTYAKTSLMVPRSSRNAELVGQGDVEGDVELLVGGVEDGLDHVGRHVASGRSEGTVLEADRWSRGHRRRPVRDLVAVTEVVEA